MITITSRQQGYAVLPRTFEETTGQQPCELWKEENNNHWKYAIGLGHCPPINCIRDGSGIVDFDQYNNALKPA